MNNKIVRYTYSPYSIETAMNVVKRIGAKYCENFSLDANEERVYRQFIMWIHGDKRFDGDLRKGIAVIGPTGTGKSVLFKIMEVYRSIDDVSYSFNGMKKQLSWGSPLIPDTLNLAYSANSEKGLYPYKIQDVLYFDDAGTEESSAKFMGNELKPTHHVLFHRHRLNKLTMMSSNLKKTRLKEVYGARIYSRMNEMFNFLMLKTDDKRELKT